MAAQPVTPSPPPATTPAARWRRHRALVLGLVAGLLAAIVIRAALDPSRWFPAHLGRVYVVGNCSYSRVAVDLLAADPAAPYVALPLAALTPEFDAPVCTQTLDRLTREGIWWLALIPEATACPRLQQWAGDHYAQETPAQGFPAWVDARGEFRGFGVDPRQIAALGLTPTAKIVDFWVDGGYARDLVESLGFDVPATTRQGAPLRLPHAEPAPHPRPVPGDSPHSGPRVSPAPSAAPRG
jgi:hypothetical protein